MINAFIEQAIKHLAEFPDQVTVQSVPVDGQIMLNVKVAGTDLAKVIGSHGRVIRSLKTISGLIAPGSVKDIIVEIAS